MHLVGTDLKMSLPYLTFIYHSVYWYFSLYPLLPCSYMYVTVLPLSSLMPIPFIGRVALGECAPGVKTGGRKRRRGQQKKG